MMTRFWLDLVPAFQRPGERLFYGLALGIMLSGLYWINFTGPFPLAEFCARNRPTWVIPVFERASYTAMSGERFLGVVVVAGGLYLLALRFATGLRGRMAAAILVGVVPMGLILILLPSYPLLSGDIFKYVFSGRILTVYGQNPFTHVPAEFPQDRFYDLVYWKAVTNAHGPLWRLAEAASASIGGESCAAAILAMKGWPAAAYFATTWMVYLMIRAYHPERAIQGAMVYAWNPLVVLEAVQNGHNDAVAALPAVIGLWLALRGHPSWAIPLLATSALIKPLAALLAPLFVIVALRGPRRHFRRLMLGVGVSGTLVVAAYAPFWEGLDTLQGLSRAHIFSTSPAAALVDLLAWTGVPLDHALTVSATAANGLFILLSIPLFWSVWRGRLAVTPAALALVFLYCLVASQWFNPWYLLWLMPFAALVDHRSPRTLGVAFTLLALWIYAVPFTIPAVFIVFVPMTLLAVGSRRWLGWGSPAGCQSAAVDLAVNDSSLPILR